MNGFKDFEYILLLKGAAVGLLSGITVAVFRFAVEAAEYVHNAATSGGLSIYILLLVACAYVVICLCLKIDPNCSGSGVPRVKGELAGHMRSSWYSSLVTMLIGTACAIGSGMSMGQVGPAAQIGAMTAKGFSRISGRMSSEAGGKEDSDADVMRASETPDGHETRERFEDHGKQEKHERHERLLMISGSGAGFAAILNAPVSGILFSMEEMHRRFSVGVLLTSLAACASSYIVIYHIFGFAPLFSVPIHGTLPVKSLPFVLLLGVITGFAGILYNISISLLQSLYGRIGRIGGSWVRVAIPAVLALILVPVYPYALGGGNSLTGYLLTASPAVQALVILLIVKYLFTVLCFGSGSPGGLIGPVLVIGAIIGCLFGALAGYGDCAGVFILLGMGGYFSAIMQTPLTAIVLMCEISGSVASLPYIAIVCLVSCLITRALRSKPIFDQLLENILKTDARHVREP